MTTGVISSAPVRRWFRAWAHFAQAGLQLVVASGHP